MKKLTIECRECGQKVELDTERPQSFCPYCGQKLLIDMEQLSGLLDEKAQEKTAEKKPGLFRRMLAPQEAEPIPELPTSQEKKETKFYVKQAVMWAVITAAFIGALLLLYALAGRLAG